MNDPDSVGPRTHRLYPLMIMADDGAVREIPGKRVLVRGDTGEAIGVVSDHYILEPCVVPTLLSR